MKKIGLLIIITALFIACENPVDDLTATYTVNYDSQNATVEANPALKTVTSPATTVGTLPTAPTKTGYIFRGWYTEVDGGGIEFTASSIVTEDISVYAKWDAYTYTVTYDSQSATVDANPNFQTVLSPATSVGTLPTAPTKNGYFFGGWFTEVDGGGTEFTANSIVTEDISVYALWSSNPTYTVTYDSQNATVEANPALKTVISPATTVGTLPTAPTKIGYIFGGWYTEVDGGGTEFNASTVVTTDITIFAKWEIIPTYNFQYNGNGNSSGNTPTSGGPYYEGTEIAVQTENSLIKSGFVFHGWNTEPDESGDEYLPGSVFTIGQTNTTLYAIWYNVITIAGSQTIGYKNGSADIAQFDGLYNIVVDSNGYIFVADMWNNRIRKISPTGEVSTFAGSGDSDFIDGIGEAACFYHPSGLAIDSLDNLYVADMSNNAIRKITPDAVVSTLAGDGVGGYEDAMGNPRFRGPSGIAVDSSNNLYISDFGNNCIRKITSSGLTYTLAGSTSGVSGYIDAFGNEARFDALSAIAVDNNGDLYVSERFNSRIRKISSMGDVSTLAGSGTYEYRDDTGILAGFCRPKGLVVDDNYNIYVADEGNYCIRKITPSGVVTTFAGTNDRGYIDGINTTARFYTPSGLAIDSNGDLFIADSGNSMIRKIIIE